MTITRDSVDALLSSRRILVLGPCGSGKTVLTRQLSQILGLPAVHLDASFWRPGWISTPQAEWRDVVRTLISEESWIMDGTYESTLDLRIPAAEAIILVNCPRWSSLFGVVRRSLVYRNRPRPDAPPGQPIDLAYLRYIWRYPTHTSARVTDHIRQYGADRPVISLENRAKTDTLLSAMRQGAGVGSVQQCG